MQMRFFQNQSMKRLAPQGEIYYDIAENPSADGNMEESAMFRLWAKVFQNNHMLRDICIADESIDTRTHKVFRALEEACYQFDLGKPIWLDKNISEFKRLRKTRFNCDNFIESINFDYLEIQIIEED